ncbi:MAG: M20/M25/M40 family metallo-hydrolase [Labilithrix sp.]|nr:M20/M25/M40 family metallo-hydrolase [Labilithrix sp.]MCW5817118.1 M20/M25/M40 family metallo-hydrolase [Labilithrix sp.]
MSDPVAILSKLVAYRSDVVGGEERPIAEHLAELFRGLGPDRGPDEVTVGDVPRPNGKTASWVYARYGAPKVLVNAHLDTVPPNSEWSADPFTPRVADGKLYALGACDTKGAAAAILAALAETQSKPKDVGVLFSGDEEFSSVVMRWFVKSPHREGLERAIVCEPTNLRVGTRHRGFHAFEVTVEGPGGHSSRADTTYAPLARLARLATAFDDWAAQHKGKGPEGFPGMCMNVAKLDGGVAFNVIPPQGRLLASIRVPPGVDSAAIGAELRALQEQLVPEATFTFLRENVPFATRDPASFVELVGDAAKAPIDLGFWTEAALLAQAGVDAVVIGPGDIAQAHGPDEWVPLDELHRAKEMFQRVFAR